VASAVHRIAGPGIVGRNAAVGVDAKDFAVQRGEVLGSAEVLGIPGGQIEGGIRPKDHAATVVGPVPGDFIQDGDGIDQGLSVKFVAHNALFDAAGGIGIGHKNLGGQRKGRMQSHAQQSAFGLLVNHGAEVEDYGFGFGYAMDPADQAVPFGHPQVIALNQDFPRHIETSGHGIHLASGLSDDQRALTKGRLGAKSAKT